MDRASTADGAGYDDADEKLDAAAAAAAAANDDDDADADDEKPYLLARSSIGRTMLSTYDIPFCWNRSCNKYIR